MIKLFKKIISRLFGKKKKQLYKIKKRARCYDCRYWKTGKVCVGGYNMTSYRRKNGCLRFLRLK